MKRWCVLVALVFLLGGCSEGGIFAEPTPTPTCQELAAPYVETVNDLLERWDDAVDVAGSTARMSLSGPISELQEIRREANDLESPQCARLAQTRLVTFMDSTIDAFLIFMSNEEESEVDRQFSLAGSARTSFQTEYEKLIIPQE